MTYDTPSSLSLIFALLSIGSSGGGIFVILETRRNALWELRSSGLEYLDFLPGIEGVEGEEGVPMDLKVSVFALEVAES